MRQQLTLDLGPSLAPTLEGFVAGGNAQAVAHLHALRAGDAPVFLWGAPGSGKTHLLRAMAQSWVNAGGVVASFGADVPVPWQLPAQAQAMTLDDCERLDADQQHAAFAAFIQAIDQGLVVLAAGAYPPVDLPVRDDLKSRLAWGTAFRLLPLADDDLRHLLQQQARTRGLLLPDDVLNFLLLRFTRDSARLLDLLDRLDAYALQMKRAPTVALLRQMLNEAPHPV